MKIIWLPIKYWKHKFLSTNPSLGIPLLGFRSIKAQRNKFTLSKQPLLALQDDTFMFVVTLISRLGSAILDLTIFLTK